MLDVLVSLIAIMAGSALGGAFRFFVSGLVARAIGETFPWGTMAVNVTGSLTLGVLTAFAGGALHDAPFALRLAALDFLGSYTTVSSFSLQTLALMREGEVVRAAANVALSLGLCLGAAAAGFAGASLAFGG